MERGDRKEGDGLPIAFDPDAESTSDTLPGFLARPSGAPVYHGFVILDEVEVEGFRFGKITDFEGLDTRVGDAFVVAPDNSRAGLVWELADNAYVQEISPLEPGRWGVWAVGFPHAMSDTTGARANLAALLPLLRPKWEQWKTEFEAAE